MLAARFRIGIEVASDLGENNRSATGFLPPAEFEKVADAFFANPEESVRGWERAIDAQRRIREAVDRIVANQAVAISRSFHTGRSGHCFSAATAGTLSAGKQTSLSKDTIGLLPYLARRSGGRGNQSLREDSSVGNGPAACW